MERQPSGAPIRSARDARLLRFRLVNASFLFLAIMSTAVHAAARQTANPRDQTHIDEALRREGEAVIELANTAMDGRAAPSDFTIVWRNDFL